jgi:hypothetical protein
MSMPDTSVKYFDSTMSSAPALANTAGNLIAILDACLVNGFGVGTLDSVAVVDDVATCTISAGHGLAMMGTTGPVIRISGVAAPDTALNGDWRVASVPSSTTFTFATTGITNRTVNTVACQRAPAGFSKAFTGTNKAAYRSDDVTGTRLYLRVDDTGTTNARIRGYEAMSDIDTGSGLFPTDAQLNGGGYVYKTTTPTRAWTLLSDRQLMYFFCDAAGDSAWQGGFVFGDIESYASPDSFCSLLILSATSSGSTFINALSNASGAYLARSYTQLGGSIVAAKYSHARSGGGTGSGGQAYPAPVDNGAHLWPVEVWEGSTAARGILPGFWNPLHGGTTPHGAILEDFENLPNRTLRVQTTGGTSYECAIDVTGPWR